MLKEPGGAIVAPDAETPGILGNPRLLEIREVAFVPAVATHIPATVLTEELFREHPLQRAKLNMEFHRAGIWHKRGRGQQQEQPTRRQSTSLLLQRARSCNLSLSSANHASVVPRCPMVGIRELKRECMHQYRSNVANQMSVAKQKP